MRQIILASTSPRRIELMKKLRVKFEIFDSRYREVKHKRLTPGKLVALMAKGKARKAALKYPRAIIVAADTVVEFKGKVLGKPKNNIDAFRILKMLSGKVNYILTGLAVYNGASGKMFISVTKNKIVFKKYSDEVINKYIKTGEPKDKAGAYAIQGLGGKLVKKIVGDRNSAIGLPVKEVKKILKKLNTTIL